MGFILNIFTSGKHFKTDNEELDLFVRYVLLNAMIFLGGSLLILFGVQSLHAGALLQGIFDLSMAAITIFGFILLRTNVNFSASSFLTVVSFFFLCTFLIQSGGIQGSGVLWAYSFPLLAIFLLGIRIGTVLAILLGMFLCAIFFIPGISQFTYERAFAFRGIGVYILVTTCTIVYEITKINKDKRLLRLTQTIQAERDQISAMKDNLPTGIFLLDEQLCIQSQYSPKLEQIFTQSNLSGASFINLLQNSLQNKELDLLHDYFEMLLNKSHDQSLLEEINPLKEFSFTPLPGGEIKYLSIMFTTFSNENNKTFILGSVQDLTKERALQLQLEAEERKRQKEMRSLFEIIHIEPRLFQDFINETEENFQAINELLKDQTKPTHEVITEIYQLIHAVKSNAVILGLQEFGEKLHGLERELNQLKVKHEVTFNDLLHFTLEMESVLQEKDSFKGLLERLKSFTRGSNTVQEEVILIKTLEKLIEKTAQSLGKEAKLVIKQIDSHALNYVPFKDLKDILTQIVRNALVHGIETPAERKRLKKAAHGLIELSIKQEHQQIICTITDDGRGISFDVVRQRAQEQQLIDSQDNLSREQLLALLFNPGFSTEKTSTLHAGRGIGLSLVKDRIKKLNGSIGIQTKEGRGCRFIINFPVLQESAASAV
ncbi:ATP-binding protein [Gracilinema caldarium]|uniref:histidine kinase n=1 Tax=Gracilinema caldarium (strain ATCC 51460 / DSM 7334 / H1) TaxID=744872 RepID=F8F4J0_GRAC1|nr:ATP-binding protein [Gracilinema caldarium]AEJ20637.1 CheA signal transduction histidine kinase [Gracilinema caldarium DSM 7334]